MLKILKRGIAAGLTAEDIKIILLWLDSPLGQKITNEKRERMTKAQREYFLREQLRAIRRELGEEDENGEPGDLRKRIEDAGLPDEARREAERELNRLSNVPPTLTDSGRTTAMTVKHALDVGAEEVEVTPEAQKAWVDLLLTGAGRMMGAPDCTPGYYNNEGQSPGPAAKYNVGYPQGATAFFKYIEDWRTSGQFEGLAFR